MTTGRTVVLSLALMAVVGLGAPMAYRYYLLNMAVPHPAAAPSTAPALSGTAIPPPLSSAPTPEPGTVEVAIAQVEEVRGSAGRIEVPDELKHHEDRRRFLAVQMADSQERAYRLPDDEADLVEMIQRGELVEIPALGNDHVLYDLGTDVRDDPLVHYDPELGKTCRFPSFDVIRSETPAGQLRRHGKGRGQAAPSRSCASL